MSLLLELIQETGLGARDLIFLIHTAPARYKTFEIAKRNGGKRTIAQPSRELKVIQRYILREKLVDFPVHHSAMAYISGRNIFDNATTHSGGGHILKLDFEGFFPGIKAADFSKFIKSNPHKNIQISDLHIYLKCLFWSQEKKSVVPRALSIGAPTSPHISNILLFDLDRTLSDEAEKRGLKYTRYADDITVSGRRLSDLHAFQSYIRRVLKQYKTTSLVINEKKTGTYIFGQRQTVTGLVLTPSGDVSIGRTRKRLISSLVFRYKMGNLDVKQTAFLKGMLGFAIANEVSFVERLRDKYGSDIVTEILREWTPTRAQLKQ